MTVPAVRVTLDVYVPDVAGAASEWMSLDEILAGIRGVPNVTDVQVADEFDVTRCIEVYVDISGHKRERHAAHRKIMRLFEREKNQLRSQSYDLVAMHAD